MPTYHIKAICEYRVKAATQGAAHTAVVGEPVTLCGATVQPVHVLFQSTEEFPLKAE